MGGHVLDEVGNGYARWLSMPFPPHLRGAEVAQVSVVPLDAEIAGCVHGWLSFGGMLDSSRWDCLGRCLADLDRVMPLLVREEEIAYFSACREVAQLVWDSDGPTAA
jgi:hypothetical protein